MDDDKSIVAKRYKGYLGNPFLKKPYAQIQWTEKQVLEYDKCRTDLFHFINNYVKIEMIGRGINQIKLWPRQYDMFNNLNTNRFNIFLIPRQSAKCVSVNTKVKIKHDNKIIEISLGDLHEAAKDKEKLYSLFKGDDEES